jgi:hypothetical protein
LGVCLAPCVPCVSFCAGLAAATQPTYAAHNSPCPVLLRAIPPRSERDRQAGDDGRVASHFLHRPRETVSSFRRSRKRAPSKGTGQIYGYTCQGWFRQQSKACKAWNPPRSRAGRRAAPKQSAVSSNWTQRSTGPLRYCTEYGRRRHKPCREGVHASAP